MEIVLPTSFTLPDTVRLQRQSIPFLYSKSGAVLPALLFTDSNEPLSDEAIVSKLESLGYRKTPEGDFELAGKPAHRLPYTPSNN